jgi:hypothetical protein
MPARVKRGRPAAVQARKPAKPCPGGSAVERSVQARVYERGGDEHVLVGCYLRSGRRTSLAGWFSCGAETGALIGLVIKPNGSVVYLPGQRLIRIDPRGSTVLDEGPGIDPASLAVNRTRVYWLHDNAPRTASLR